MDETNKCDHVGEAEERETSPRGSALQVNRRGFLVGGSACLLGAVALSSDPGLPREAPLEAATAETAPLPLSIGYWCASESSSAAGLGADGRAPESVTFRPDVTSADRLPYGDEDLLREGARVTIHGLFGPLSRPVPLAVSAHYTVGESAGRQTIRVRVWSVENSPTLNVSRPVSFFMPTDAEEGVVFSLTRPTAARSGNSLTRRELVRTAAWEREGDELAAAVCRLTMAEEPEAPKLKRGVYFIPIDTPRMAAPPNWEAYQFRAVPTIGAPAHRQLYQQSSAGLAPADFAYLVLSIGPAASEARAWV